MTAVLILGASILHRRDKPALCSMATPRFSLFYKTSAEQGELKKVRREGEKRRNKYKIKNKRNLFYVEGKNHAGA